MSRPISRRRAGLLGGLGVSAVAVGVTGLTRQNPAGSSAVAGGAVDRTAGGAQLRVRLDAAQGPVGIGGWRVRALSYNRGLPGPTLQLHPGDRLQVQLVNHLQAPTNLHVHGLHVSPEGRGDNPFVTVEPGRTFDYDYQLPADHPPGVFWYHPHHHGLVADQVFGGLSGAIIVADPAVAAAIPVTRERVLVISDISLDSSGTVRSASLMERVTGREGDLVLVNGQVRPVLTARPGQRERWRVVNACVSRYLRLRVDGQTLQLLGLESGGSPSPVRYRGGPGPR